jgi:hypothetical protein
MRRSGVPSVVLNSPAARSPRGRRAVAAVCVLAVLPLAALAGCAAGANPKPAAAAPRPAAAARQTAAAAPQTVAAAPQAAARVALQFDANVSRAAGPAPAAIAKFRWSALASSPLGYRNSPLLAWADGRLLEFGGFPAGSTGRSAAGAAFDPATGRWRRIANAPPGGSFAGGDSSAVWTGRYLAVASGDAEPCPGNPAPAPHCWTGLALYNPTANRWTVLAVPRQFDGLPMEAVVWTGHDLIVGAASLSATNPDVGRLALAAYSPTTRRWQLITPALPRGHTPGALNLVYDDGRLLLWSLWQDAVKPGTWGTDVLTMNARGVWRNVTGHWPQGTAFVLSDTSDGIMVAPGGYWCGDLCTGYGTSGAAAYFANPATMALKRIPAGPLSELSPGAFSFVWAGDAIIAVSTVYGRDGSPGHYILSGDMAMYDPATQRWTDLRATPGHPEITATPVWIGAELLTLTTSGALLAFHR